MTRKKKGAIPDHHTTKYPNQYKLAIVKDNTSEGEPYVHTRKSTGYAALGALSV